MMNRKSEPQGLQDYGVDPAVAGMLQSSRVGGITASDGKKPQREKRRRITASDDKKRRREKYRDKSRLPRRVNFEIPVQLKSLLADISERDGIPQSQLIAFFALLGYQIFESKNGLLDEYRRPSKSPRWNWNLDLDRLLDEVLEN